MGHLQNYTSFTISMHTSCYTAPKLDIKSILKNKLTYNIVRKSIFTIPAAALGVYRLSAFSQVFRGIAY